MRWRYVPGYETQYLVSESGHVYSTLSEKLLRPGTASNGYLTVSLRRKSHCVQHLVAAAFLGPRPEGALVLHCDGDRTNNCVANLRYGTASDNRKDAEMHGTVPRGTAYASAKLDDDAVRYIRAKRGEISQSRLARMFGVSPAAVQAVHDNRTWTHVE
jgi:hypothetical protein